MKRIIIFTLLILLVIAPTSYALFENTLQQFEKKLNYVNEVQSISITISNQYLYIGRLWIVEKGRAVELGLWRLQDKNDNSNFAFKQGWMTYFNLKSNEYSKVSYLPDKVPTKESNKLKETLKNVRKKDYWVESPWRFCLLTKYIKNLKKIGVKELFDKRWEVYEGSCDLVGNYNQNNDNPTKGSVEVWLQSDKNSWLEIYRRADGKIVTAREGKLKLNTSDSIYFNNVESASQLTEYYLSKYQNSLVGKIINSGI